MSRPLAVICLAAGMGTRTKVSTPKVLLPLCGRSLVETVLDTVAELEPERTVVVLHHQIEQVRESLGERPGMVTVDQGEPRGTGHAVQVAMGELQDFDGDILVCYGDMPLVQVQTYQALREARGDDAAAILTAYPDDPSGLGRILRDDDGGLVGVREERDCDDLEREIDEINVGIYCYDAQKLRPALERLSDDNAQGELYLTDTVELLLDVGHRVESVVVLDQDEALGINTLLQLADARAVMQQRILEQHMLNGVLIEDPATTYIDHGVEIGRDTHILPCTVIRRGVVIGEGCEAGPFSHLRAATVLEDGAEVGNFVEVKKSRIGSGTKAKHLTYLGDTVIGKGANIGAGTITCNYDGKHKHQTKIGDGAFIGSGALLVAPVVVGNRALTGAGAVVRRDTVIADDETWVGVPARRLPNSGKASNGSGGDE